MSNPAYRGRFAPSPTGPLHFGSLLAAVASYAQARQQQGKWLVRIEDVDLPRCDTDSTSLILNALEVYGMHWDEDIVFQSQRTEHYQAALEILSAKNLIYGCACSRKQIIRENKNAIYPGTCRNGLKDGKVARSIRLRTNNEEISFNDKVQGHYAQNISRDVGDFIIKRADNLFAYQLAVVVDDEDQGITEVVRGSDMLDSTPRQILLQQYLSYSIPDYAHIPLATKPDGSKLSKQSMARAIPLDDPIPTLIKALNFLGQQPPEDLGDSNVESIWAWVIEHWSINTVPAQLNITYNETDD